MELNSDPTGNVFELTWLDMKYNEYTITAMAFTGIDYAPLIRFTCVDSNHVMLQHSYDTIHIPQDLKLMVYDVLKGISFIVQGTNRPFDIAKAYRDALRVTRAEKFIEL